MNTQEEIKRREELFANKTNAEKRVLVAQDVINLLDIDKIGVRSTYFDSTEAEIQLNQNPQKGVREILLELNSPCQVCAKGAIMLSLTLFNNQETDFNGWKNLHSLNSIRFKNGLLDIFSQEQLNLIETYFEGYVRYTQGEGDYNKLLSWHQPGISSPQLLRNIMQNIIDNNGDFTP